MIVSCLISKLSTLFAGRMYIFIVCGKVLPFAN